MAEKCGCKIVCRAAYRPAYQEIEFCPTHAAAPLMLEALTELMECPYQLDEASIPKTGIDAAPNQVVGNMSVAWMKIVKAKAALTAAEPPKEGEE